MTAKIERFLEDAQPPTPCLVVDLDIVEESYRTLHAVLPLARIFYAVKANPAAPILDRLNAAVETILAGGVPMLLVRGQVSDLVSQERADEFLARFSQVEFVDVRGAGHMVAGDRNDVFADAVLDFLSRHGRF